MQVQRHNNPLVSVTFPIHRYHEYAVEALKSILNQSYSNLEILFLDNSKEGLAKQFDIDDSRIKYFKLPHSYGLADTLNFALEKAEGRYLARMDYDDISFPDRISSQVEFMENHKEVAISGSFIETFGESIDRNVKPNEIVKRPVVHEELLQHLISKNPFFHPTVIFRLEVIREKKLFYNPKYDSAEDLELWCRASHQVRLANLDRVLLKYRIHSSQFSRLDGLNSTRNAIKISIRHTLWMIAHKKIPPKQGIKTLRSNIIRFAEYQSRYIRSKKFNKFE